ncbi:N-glycosylase/DNA DNA lyase-like isoform X1 [Octopus vulgaris]|uniref:N-glycosylase/DNA lyase n=1 Tax=Octopus vulgaris TaxID=6645 RepID=A0AA36BRU6_OCTVU|nr:N-glycosylase/DNA DNA lyase-like isoform X1 [Octopus vulgaris]
MARQWHRLPCTNLEVQLDIVLSCGQSFRWSKTSPSTWTGVFASKLWHLKQEEEDNIMYQASSGNQNDCEQELRNYFQLHISVKDLYEKWREADPVFCKTVGTKLQGIRVLRQDPVENLFSFICSSNNNIERITLMIEKLCCHYGEEIGSFEGKPYYAFPTVDAMSVGGVEEKLRELGFGYRAGYISKSAKYIASLENGVNWLYNLRKVSYENAKEELQKLTGVGAKVADCVCLMSLDKTGAIPVDTHVLQITSRDYLPKLQGKQGLSTKCYNEIGDHFRNIWGEYAGWAQTVLFASDLRRFKDKNEEPQTKKKKTSSKKTEKHKKTKQK